jgi:hypothetical protein
MGSRLDRNLLALSMCRLAAVCCWATCVLARCAAYVGAPTAEARAVPAPSLAMLAGCMHAWSACLYGI